MANRRNLVLGGIICLPLGLRGQTNPAAKASGRRLSAGEDTQGALFVMEHKHTKGRASAPPPSKGG